MTYIGDTGNSRVRKVTSTGIISTLSSEIQGASGQAKDGSGNIYAVAQLGHSVYRVTSAGAKQLVFGTGIRTDSLDGPGGNPIDDLGDGGNASASSFNFPTDIVIDGGGKVTLSGGGTTRILYMNTCDEAQHWTTSHCDNQETPRLTVQNVTFVDGNSKNEPDIDNSGGGGAIWVRGGRFKAVNTRFFSNVCQDEGPDVGGAGIRVFSQFDGLPVYVVNSTFGGADGFGNTCANGGGISSIGVSWTIINSLFTHNRAIGNGGNPAQAGTPGGGSGGAIYNDGNEMTLSLCGTRIEENTVTTHGQAIFFVTNNHTGDIQIRDSIIRNNHGGSWYALPGISMHDDTANVVESSILELGN